MQKTTINKSYAHAALLIHATNQEVTKDKIESVFKALGLEYSSKVASMFSLSPSKYVDLLSSTGSSAPVAAVSEASASVAAAEKVQEEESEEDADIDF